MRTLVIAQDKTTLKAIGKVLRKAKVEYVVARKIEGAEDTIREKEISLVIINSLADQNKSNREKQIRNFLYKLMFEELFPQIHFQTSLSQYPHHIWQLPRINAPHNRMKPNHRYQ